MTTAEKFRQLEASPLIKIVKFYTNNIRTENNVIPLKDCVKSIKTGKTPIKSNPKFYEDEYLSWYKPDEIGGDMYLNEAKSKLSKYCYLENKATIYEENTLLINAIGDLGRLSILKHEASSNQQITGILFNENVVVEYAYYYLIANRNLFFDDLYNPIMPIINQKKLQTIEIILPSIHIQEQLINDLEIIKNIKSFDDLKLIENTKFDVDTKKFAFKIFCSIYTKNNISTEITHQLDLIKNLRQAFLREAMQGLLVSNETSDNKTGADLLAEIQAEKAQLVKEKKIKKPKTLAPITEEELLFDIPENWMWCRLGEILKDFLSGNAFKSQLYSKVETTNFVIRLGNVKNNIVDEYLKPAFIDDKYAKESQKYLLEKDDILITMTGTRGKKDYLYTSLVGDKGKNKLFLNQRVGCLRFISSNVIYLNYLLKLDFILNPIFDSSTGAANQANIGVDAINNAIIPLPPLEIQERIVAKLDELMRYCDALEEQVKQSQQTNEMLLQQVLREALGA